MKTDTGPRGENKQTVILAIARKKRPGAPAALLAEIEPAGFRLLPVTGEHAAAVAGLPTIHNDPFDRMLVAQAKTEPLLLLTNDGLLAGYGDCIELVSPRPRR
jgi:PIN domain nuclease of toxin-antitoxin system